MYHLRSNSGSSGPVAKDCHRFLVVGPFKLLGRVGRPIVSPVPSPWLTRLNRIVKSRSACTSDGCYVMNSLTLLTTDAGASTSNSTAPSLYFRE
jgi:hypothetical protein